VNANVDIEMKTTLTISILILFFSSACSNQSKDSQVLTEEETIRTITQIAEEYTRAVESETDLFVLFLDGSEESSEDLILQTAEYCSRASLTFDAVLVDEVDVSRSKELGIENFPSGIYFKDGERKIFEGREEIRKFMRDRPNG